MLDQCVAQSCRRGRGGLGKSQSYFSFLLSLYIFFSFLLFIIFRLQRKQKRRWWTSSIIHRQILHYIYNILYGVAVATFLSQSVHACIFQPTARLCMCFVSIKKQMRTVCWMINRLRYCSGEHPLCLHVNYI